MAHGTGLRRAGIIGRQPDRASRRVFVAAEAAPTRAFIAGVQEIRVRDASGAFRVIHVAKFTDAVYVRHCFQKKTRKTSKADLDLAEKRYRDLMKGRCQ